MRSVSGEACGRSSRWLQLCLRPARWGHRWLEVGHGKTFKDGDWNNMKQPYFIGLVCWGKSRVFTMIFFWGFPAKMFPSSNSMNIGGGFKHRIWAFTQQWEKEMARRTDQTAESAVARYAALGSDHEMDQRQRQRCACRQGHGQPQAQPIARSCGSGGNAQGHHEGCGAGNGLQQDGAGWETWLGFGKKAHGPSFLFGGLRQMVNSFFWGGQKIWRLNEIEMFAERHQTSRRVQDCRVETNA